MILCNDTSPGKGKLKFIAINVNTMYRCRVIRHKDLLSSASYGTRDKFRLHVWDQNHKSVIGTCTTINMMANSQLNKICRGCTVVFTHVQNSCIKYS